MNDQQFILLRNQVCTYWKDIEKHKLAYRSESQGNRKNADRLKWATIVVGAVTGASGVFGFLPAATIVTQVVTSASGTLTALLIAANQHFKWDEEATNLWRLQNELDNIQRSLQRYLYDVARNPNGETDPAYFERLDQSLSSIIAQQARDLEKFAAQAEDALNRNYISEIVLNHEDEQDFAGDASDEVAMADAVNQVAFVPIQRAAAPI